MLAFGRTLIYVVEIEIEIAQQRLSALHAQCTSALSSGFPINFCKEMQKHRYMKWENKASSDFLLSQQHFCQKLS